MSRPRRATRRPSATTVVAGLVVAAVAAGCGGTTATTAGSPTTAAPAPTGTGDTGGSGYQIVPDAQVTAGLATVRRQAAEIKTTLARSQPEAEAQVKAMFDGWFVFEGTVRKNDKNAYLQMEDGLAAIKAGVQQNDPAKVDKGIAELEAGASTYQAAHP